jgi:tetratricopeptide (TPR) repeat protein
MRTRASFTNGRIILLLLISAALSCGCQTSPPASNEARMYEGFGGYARTVTTDSPDAQRWFDQGIQLLYGFNHDEAIRSFRQAAVEDPNCAMAWWGVSYASGLHINNPEMSEEQSRQAWDAAREAERCLPYANPVEQVLIKAVIARYEWPNPDDRSHLDQAYADAMEDAWRRFPNDADVGALYAEALMDLQPWDLWTNRGEPKGRTLEVIAVLERVLEIDPYHPGANHFYIHTMEASLEPERATASADRLVDMVPGSGHLVHMPSHIYARLGRWPEAADANERAVAADRAYFALAPAPDFYSLYYVHNLHFLAYAAMMEGRYETAMTAAREMEADVPESFIRTYPQYADGLMPVTWHVMIRFGKWEDILAEPKPPAFRHISVATHHYARGVALSALGRTAEARREHEAFEREVALIPDDWRVGNNTGAAVMSVARQMLIGELAYREGEFDLAFSALREGVAFEEDLVYDEPPGWMQPVRHALGALLMGVDRFAEAEQVYRDDLKRNPNNGWALLGLDNALRAQGKTDEAVALAGFRQEVWARSDVKPLSSCYCEPGR